ncbi:MAG: hypothetical protein PUP93_10310 [Rhizonema sp. NSF051]|nr:hypothetical protein [Rhizonema sp. NSF051]
MAYLKISTLETAQIATGNLWYSRHLNILSPLPLALLAITSPIVTRVFSVFLSDRYYCC